LLKTVQHFIKLPVSLQLDIAKHHPKSLMQETLPEQFSDNGLLV